MDEIFDASAMPPPEDGTLLEKAAQGDLDYVRAAAERGASMNASNSKGDNAVTEALRHGHPEVAKYAIAHGFSARTRGDGAVYWAASTGEREVLTMLLDAGAKPDASDPPKIPPEQEFSKSMRNPLAAAIMHGHRDVARELIKRGAATAGVVHDDDTSLLMIAVRARDHAMLDVLLESGVTYQRDDPPNELFDTMLIGNWADGVQSLLAHGFPLDASEQLLADPKVDRELVLAIRTRQVERRFEKVSRSDPALGKQAVELCLAMVRGESPTKLAGVNAGGPLLNVRDSAGWTLLCYAIFAERLDWARALVDRGSQVNLLLPGVSSTPLHFAVERCNFALVEFLVARGANPELCVAGGVSVLDCAIQTGNESIFAWLLAHGARVEPKRDAVRGAPSGAGLAVGSPKSSPLLTALRRGRARFALRLIESGADVNFRDCDGVSVGLLAASLNDATVLAALRSRRVDIEQCLKESTPFLNHAVYSRNQETAEQLLRAGVPLGPETVHLAMGSPECIKLVETYAAGPAGRPAREALFWIRMGRHSDDDVLEALNAGADPNLRGGETPLQMAAGSGRVGVVRHLLSHGADPNLVGAEVPKAPILCAISHKVAEGDETRTVVVKMLLDAGADIEVRSPSDPNFNNGGRTPLMQAIMSGAPSVVRLLLDAGADIRKVADNGMTVFDCVQKSQQLTEAQRRTIEAWLNSAARSIDKLPDAKPDPAATRV